MVLVTGGTGFLGAHLLYHLLQKGERIRALKRAQSSFDLVHRVFSFYTKNCRQEFNRIEWQDADLLDLFSLDEILEGITKVYHVAAKVSFQPADHEEMMSVNVRGTANLVNTALERKVDRFCFVSSIAAIGRADNEKLIDEKTVWKESKRNSRYALSKYLAEKEVWRGFEEGLKGVIVNPSIILGPGEVNSGIAKLISIVNKGMKFYTTGINGYVDVRDVAEIMIRLTNSEITAERYVLSSENVIYKDLMTSIAQSIDKPPPAIRATPVMAEIAWRLSYLQSIITRSKPLITKETSATAQNVYTYSNQKIKKLLDFKFIPVKESIKTACGYYLASTENHFEPE
ncbi:MAG: NAD-dependent epimerase/dehydratase family protein [Bacteroidales bacterium]